MQTETPPGLICCDEGKINGSFLIEILRPPDAGTQTTSSECPTKEFRASRNLKEGNIPTEKDFDKFYNDGKNRPLISARNSHIGQNFTISNTYFPEDSRWTAGAFLNWATLARSLIVNEGTCFDVLVARGITVEKSIIFQGNNIIASDLDLRDSTIKIELFRGSKDNKSGHVPSFLRELKLDHSHIGEINLASLKRGYTAPSELSPKCSMALSNIAILKFSAPDLIDKKVAKNLGGKIYLCTEYHTDAIRFEIENTQIGRIVDVEDKQARENLVLTWLSAMKYHGSLYAIVERIIHESGDEESATKVFLQGKKARIDFKLGQIELTEKVVFNILTITVMLILGFTLYLACLPVSDPPTQGAYCIPCVITVLQIGVVVLGAWICWRRMKVGHHSPSRLWVGLAIFWILSLCASWYFVPDSLVARASIALLAYLTSVHSRKLRLELEKLILFRFAKYGCEFVRPVAVWFVIVVISSVIFSNKGSVNHPLQYQAQTYSVAETYLLKEAPKHRFDWFTYGGSPSSPDGVSGSNPTQATDWEDCLYDVGMKGVNPCITVGGLAMGLRLSLPMIPNYLASDWIPSSNNLEIPYVEWKTRISYSAVAFAIQLCSCVITRFPLFMTRYLSLTPLGG